MTVRFVTVSGYGAGLVVGHIAKSSHSRSILLVSARLPLKEVRSRLVAAGAIMEHVYILDATPDDGSIPTLNPDREGHIGNPTLLELIALRVIKIIKAKAERDVTVVVDDAGSFARYNPDEVLREIVVYASHMTAARNDVEFVVAETELAHYQTLLGASVDEAVHLPIAA